MLYGWEEINCMRYFFEDLISDKEMLLSDESAKHIVRVLRMQVGDKLILTDGKGTKARAQIIETSKTKCKVFIEELQHHEQHPSNVSLGISFTKNSARMEWLFEKATEIGIKEIFPMLTNRTERTKLKRERYEKIFVSAMLQSQQSFVPLLHNPIAFDELIKKEYNQKLIAHCEVGLERMEINHCQPSAFKSQLILIGPEGDFTSQEIEAALQQNFKSVSLGKNRLRTETAGLVAVTLLSYV